MTAPVAETPPQTGEQIQQQTQQIPDYIAKRRLRGREAMRKQAPLRRLYYKFWRGESYWNLRQDNVLVSQSTISVRDGGSRPPQRVRNKYPFVAMIVQAKVSASTQRVPSYEVVPTKTDPNVGQAADLAAKVLLYGYDKWRLRRMTTKAFEHALVGGEGFAYPQFDASVGPYVEDPATGEMVGQGEIKVPVFSANEVYWEPGTDFEESRWYCVEQAVPVDVVKEMPGYLDGALSADATDSDAPSEADKKNLALVSEYLERPSAKNPNGLRIVMANGRRIVADEDYPCLDHEGNVRDEPVLVRISYTVDTDDRDRGLVELIVDLQRTIQDCWNKILEYKNRGLNLQMTAPRGSDMARRDDTPGAVWFYRPIAGLKPEWEPPPSPAYLNALLQILDKAIEHLRALSADVDVQPDPRLTSQTAQAAIEQAQLRWQTFLGDGAEFHSRVARHCLYLVQRFYSEGRLLNIMGTFGPDLTPAFRGADLLGQADVRVAPDSLASKSRQSVINETLLFADRGWISPQAAMATIRGGVAEKLGQSYEADIGRANFLIQTIRQGAKALMALPLRPVFPGDPPDAGRGPNGEVLYADASGQPMVPGWMPRPFDNPDVQLEVFEMWMKTTDWDRLDPDCQHEAILVYQALQDLKTRKALQAAQVQEQVAQSQGMQNAAKPQGPPALPSQRSAGTPPAPFNQENQNG